MSLCKSLSGRYLVEFNADTFKALSSKTRLSLLKHLSQRRMTLSELSKDMGLHVSSVKEHLDVLENAGIIARHDEGYKWKYYSITSGAKHAFTNPVELKLVLPASIVFIVSGLFGFAYSGILRGSSLSSRVVSKSVAEGGGMLNDAAPVFANTGVVSSEICLVSVLPVVLLALGVFLLGIFIGLKVRENRIRG